MTQGNMNRLLGIADPSWPTTSPIEKRAIELGYEAMVSSEPTGLRSRSLEFGLVVIHLPRGGSIQSIIEAMKHFDDAVQFLYILIISGFGFFLSIFNSDYKISRS